MDKRKRKRETYVRTYKEGGTISVAYGNERIYDHVQRRNTGPAHVQNPLAKRGCKSLGRYQVVPGARGVDWSVDGPAHVGHMGGAVNAE